MKRTNTGFTLVEIIVVLALIAIFFAISAPHFKGFFADRQLSNATSFFETVFHDAFSQARSEQQIVGIDVKPGELTKFTCNYDHLAIDDGCDGAKTSEEPLLWEGDTVGKNLKVSFSSDFTLYFKPPHGDLIPHPGTSFVDKKKEFTITHNTSGKEKKLRIHQLSSLLERYE